jgi:Ion channel
MNYFANPQTWIVVAVTLVVVSLCIGLHFEILSKCRTYLTRLSHRRRRRVLILIIIILLAHTVEIWIFGLGYFVLIEWLDIGLLNGLEPHLLPDFVYYSAMVYTTVGFGDIVPTGVIRFMSGVEALTGLVMITWSASYTFLEMQRDWPSEKA